jgi:hypothetical protein
MIHEIGSRRFDHMARPDIEALPAREASDPLILRYVT